MSPPPCTTIRCEDDAWAERARVAQWAADELRACSHAVSRVLATNYMGTGCSEAPPVFTELASAVLQGPSSWRGSLAQQSSAFTTLAQSCDDAGLTLDDQDRINAKPIGS